MKVYRLLSPLLFAISLHSASLSFAADVPKVGISLPLSGSLARMGEAVKRGVELYQKEHPAEIQLVKIIFDDHRYEGKQAISSFHHLTKSRKADFFIAWGNTPAETLAPIAENSKIPSLFLTNQPVAKGRSYVVSMGNRVESTVQVFADFFRSGKAGTPGALSVNIGNALSIIQDLQARLGGNLLVLSFEPDLTSFQPLILRMKQASVDQLLLFALPEQALTYAQQAKTLRFFPPTLGGDIFADRTFLTSAAPLFSSIKFVYGSVNPAFIERYRSNFSDFSFFFEAASGFALAELIYRQLGAASPRPHDWAAVLQRADLNALPLSGARLTSLPDDGLRLECESTVYEARELLGESAPHQ